MFRRLLFGAALLVVPWTATHSVALEPPQSITVDAPLLPASPPPQVIETPSAPAPTPDRWLFMNALQGTYPGALLDENRLGFSGWVASSYNFSSANRFNGPVVWYDRANEVLLQQAWLRLEHSVVSSGTVTPTFGVRLDVLAGSDYRYTVARGLFDSQLLNACAQENLYGVDPVQFYVNAYVPSLFHGTEIRLGRVYAPIGVESNEAVSTPLVSRSYTFNVAPFTTTGLLLATTISPEWSGTLMLSNGNDVFLDRSGELRFVGNIRYTQPGGRNTLQLGCLVGRGKFVDGEPFPTPTFATASEPLGRNNGNFFDLIYTHTFSSVCSYNLEALYGYQTNVPDLPNAAGGGTAHWASLVNYLYYTFTPRLNGTLRQLFDDFVGQRTGFEGLYTALTMGVQFRPRKDLIIRPEIRYDYNAESRPFENRHGLFTAGTDVIFRW